MYKATLPIAVKWKKLGLALGIEQTTLDSIEATMLDSTSNKPPQEEQMKKALWRVLNLWFLNVEPKPTWANLVKAVKGPQVNESDFAGEIAKHKCPQIIGEFSHAYCYTGSPIMLYTNMKHRYIYVWFFPILESVSVSENNLQTASRYLCTLGESDLRLLGMALGLCQSTLSGYGRVALSDLRYSLLSDWIREKDNVKAYGGATWTSLVRALRSEELREFGVADRIEAEQMQNHVG